MNWILATVIATSVNGGAVFKGQLTVGASTTGAASGTAPAAGGGGGGGGAALALATLRYNADDLALANGDPVPSWPSTGTSAGVTAALGQASASTQPSFDDQDAEMTNSVYFRPGGSTTWMKTGGLASPLDYPAIICVLAKPDSANVSFPNHPHFWEAFAQPGATANQHSKAFYWRGVDFGDPIVTAQRSHHADWFSYCIELRDAATSKLARNGEQVAQGTFTTGQNQIVDFSLGGLHNTSTSTSYRFVGKMADVAVWADIDTLGVTLSDASNDFGAAHNIPRGSPRPDEPYPYNTWSSTTVCDKSNEYGCNPAANVPQSDGCAVREIFPEGSGAEPTNTNYGVTGNIMNLTTAGQQYILCETDPADLVNGSPHISLRPPTASDIASLTVTGGLQQNLPQPWSICMTIRINAYPAVGNKRYLFTALNGGVQHEEWYFENVGGTTSLNLWGESNEPACATPPGPPCQIATAIATPALATWSALCVQYDGTGSEWALKQQGQAAQTGTWNPDPALYYHTSYSQYFFGEIGGRKTPNMDFTKVSVFGTGVDTAAMVESLATQYGL